MPDPVPSDYDRDPERWRAGTRVRSAYGSGDVHPGVAARFVTEGLAPVVDVGCGDGELPRHLPADWPWIGLDPSPTQLAGAPRPVARADATRLPLANSSAGAVALLWMLYHLVDPGLALAEARRVLRPGGLVAACATSRDDAPELGQWQRRQATTFDAEEAPALVGRHFEEVEVVRWDAPLERLPDREAVRDYLVGHLVPRPRAEEAAASVVTPLTLTKRGALVYGRRLES